MTKVSNVKKAAPVKRRKVASLDKKKARAGWLFILPFVIGFVLIYLPIIIDSIKYSVCEMRPIQGGGFNLKFVGFENYQTALTGESNFVQILIEGMKQLLFDVPAIVIFSLFMAVLLNQKMLGRAAFRAIFFIPVIISTGIMANIEAGNIMDQYMNSTGSIDDGSGGAGGANDIVNMADLSWLFENMQIGTELLEYVTGVVNNIYDIINRSGVQMLIFLAGLQSISPAIYESCSIDGATGWETFWKITFPMVSPMILVNAIYTVIDSFTAESNIVMKVIETTYEKSQVISTAMAWIYFLIVVLFVAIVSAILSAYIFYQKRD